MKKLNQELREVEEKHAEKHVETRLDTFKQSDRDSAAVAIGVISAFQKLSNDLSAGAMKALIQFQENKMHEALGFERFEHFLNESPYSPMSKHQFYERLKLLKTEGDTLFDLLNTIGIPISKRKMLCLKGESEIAIEGNEIIIGEERADLSDLPTIKALISDFAADNKKLFEANKKQDEKIETLTEQIKTGSGEFDELRRALDAQSDGTPYERALMKAMGALMNLSSEAKNLTLVEKEKRGRSDLQGIWTQIQLIRNSLLQDDFIFEDVMNANGDSSGAGISSLAKRAIAGSGDWKDEEEQ